MVNYELGKIYKIVCNETGLIYIGSTSPKYLTTRLEGHKRKYKCYLNGKCHFVTSFRVLKGGNFNIILLENSNCKDKYELQARERYYIETLDCVNKYIPNRSKQEYDKNYKDKKKKFYQENKEVIKAKNTEYYAKNKEKI
jgi:hypothetical protein